MGVIEVTGLRKGYSGLLGRGTTAIADLDLSVEAGGVHGFLGPNGSGKTTTIRVLLGLVRADAGEVRVLGQPVPRSLPSIIPEVGALVETPLFFPNFTGRLNLKLLADLAGVPDARVEECLEIVGLRDRAGDKFKSYSLGMKQRLGIAAVLLKRPRLLILDEPSNGLDPAGIREVRELIRTLGTDGHSTVFLSSHLLTEVQQVCDHVSILARGRCVASGRVGDVLAARASHDVVVTIADPVAAQQVLLDAGFAVSQVADGLLVQGAVDPSLVTRALADSGHYLSGIVPVAADLESVFLELTSDGWVPPPQTPPATGAGGAP